MTLEQFDSVASTCWRLEAREVLQTTRSVFMAAQASGRDVEKFLKPFNKIISEAEETNDLSRFVAMMQGGKLS